MKLLIITLLITGGALSVQPVHAPSTLKAEAVKTQEIKVMPATGVNYNPQQSSLMRLQGN